MYQAGTAFGDNPLYQWLSIVPFVPLALLSIAACEASRKDFEGADSGQQPAAVNKNSRPLAANNPGTTVTNEQVPINQRFRNLDEYLAYLEQYEAPIDRAWYKEISPGIYELQTGNLRTLDGSDSKRTFTREELEREFGFSK